MNELRFRECARLSRDTKHKRYFSQMQTHNFRIQDDTTMDSEDRFLFLYEPYQWKMGSNETK